MSHSQDHFYNYIVLNLVVSVWLFTSEYWPSRVEARRRRFAVLGSLLVHFYQQEQNTAKHMRKYIEHFISLLPQWFLDSSEDEGIWASSGVHLARNVCLLLVKAVKQRGKGSNQPSLSRGREGRQKKGTAARGMPYVFQALLIHTKVILLAPGESMGYLSTEHSKPLLKTVQKSLRLSIFIS